MASIEELVAALRKLTNRWARVAQDYARSAKEAGTSAEQSAYQRGYAEGYYKAATELASVLKGELDVSAETPKPRAAQPKTGAATAAPPKPSYAAMPMSEALNLLQYVGTAPRDVMQKSDNSFRAIFSKWENMMPHERVERIKSADSRLVIIETGNTKESNDPYIDFAFKE